MGLVLVQRTNRYLWRLTLSRMSYINIKLEHTECEYGAKLKQLRISSIKLPSYSLNTQVIIFD
jgi:hypothetical protein